MRTRGQSAAPLAGCWYPGGEGDGVGAEIKQGATGEIGARDSVVGAEILTDVGQHSPNVAEDAGIQDVADDDEPGEEEGPQCLRAEPSSARWRVGLSR
jgi:hypothetical protein